MQALIAGLFTWGITAVGALIVVFTNTVSRRLLDTMLGFAAGVMIAASVWSLLIPAMEMAEAQGGPAWLPAMIGFLLGGLTMRLLDEYLPHLHLGLKPDQAEGVKTQWGGATLLVMAITLHNIPEGLAVGVAFGAVGLGGDLASVATFGGAVALAVGIGIQNFPEGLAVSMPLRANGMSKWKSVWYGQLSAIVEPIAAVVGAAAVLYINPILPYALSFAAGAMIFVVVEELIPESQQNHHEDLATIGTLGGFVVMMVLDVALG